MKKAKRILTLLMTAAMMMSMLVGCGGTSEEGDQADAGAETRDDLVVATNNASVSLIPWDNLSYFDYYVTENIYDSLMFSDATFVELEPRLAERYELSEDGLSMTLYLRSDATFHDGTPVTAEDAVFSIEQYVASPYIGTMGYVESVTALDETTVEVTFSTVNAAAPWDVANCMVLPKAAYEADPDGFRLAPVGSGPYVLTANESGSGAQLTAYEDYYRGEPSIKNVSVDIVPDLTTLDMGLQDGSIDCAIVGASSVDTLSEVDGLTLDYAPSDVLVELLMNCENEYLQDVNVRQAIAYAINTPVIADSILCGVADVNSYAPISSACTEWNAENAGTGVYDPEAARSLLEEAGYTTPIDLGTIKYYTNGTNENIAAVIQQNLADVGIQVQLEVGDTSTTVTDLYAGNYQLLLMSLAYYDSVFSARTAYDPDGLNGNNFCRYINQDLYDLFNQGLAEQDTDARQVYADEILSILAEELPGMKLCDQEVAVCYQEGLDVGELRINNRMQFFDVQWTA